MTETTKRTFRQRLAAVRWGEGPLWVLFLLLTATALDSMASEAATTLAGITALAAIGVRATRLDVRGDDGSA
jgi:hypothetical protein